MTATGNLVEAALDQVRHGVVIYNELLIVERINRRAREILVIPDDIFSEGEPFEKLAYINASRGGYGGNGTAEDRVAKRMQKARSFEPFKEDQEIFDGKFVEVHGQPILEGGYVISYTDISERFLAEKQARETDHMFQQLIATTDEGFWHIGPTGKTIDLNPAMCRILGRQKESVIGKTIFDFVDCANKDIFHAELENRRKGETGAYEISLLRPNGENVPCLNNATPIFDGNGRQIGSIGLWKDISPLKSIERELRITQEELESRVEERTKELRRSENRFRDFAEASSDWFWEMDKDLRFTYMSNAIERSHGVPAEWHYGKTREEFLGEDYNRDDWDQHLATLKAHKPFRNFTYFRVAEGAERRWVSVSGAPIFDEGGEFAGYRGTANDVTGLKHTEEQLRQAQKMEAIGQLTGGIAHDFNNLLSVIIGNLDFLQESIEGDQDQQKMMDTALQAALQGSELTNRLLSFSRKQPLRPTVIDMNKLLANVTDLLRRTLSETISIRTIAAADLKSVDIDPGQLESAILNLVINAGQAMPGGGQLTIETANVELGHDYADSHIEVEPGPYAMLVVSDKGVGMTPEVLEHAFDPFFTTKPIGEGSGLGLSMVHGFVKQSGGHISIYSEEGEGTTVRLYFRPTAAEVSPTDENTKTAPIPHGKGETVLIVEDDDSLRELAIKIVSDLGYKVEAAQDGASALAILDQGVPVDVLFTDVVLPGGMNGAALAAAALQQRPELRVLYTSGYTENAIVHNGVIDPAIEMLGKPYRKMEVALHLRQVIEHTC